MKPTRRRSFRVPAARGSNFGLALLALGASAAVAAGDPPPVPPRTTPPVAPAPHPTTDSSGDWLPAGATARLGALRFRHLGMADYVVRPDARTVRTVGRDGLLRTWDADSGRQIEAHPLGGEFAKDTCAWDFGSTYSNKRPDVGQLIFSPDRRFLAAAFPTRIVIWDAETGRELKCLERPEAGLRNAVFSPNGQTLAVRSANRLSLVEWRTDRQWTVNYHVPAAPDGNENNRWWFSPDGRYLLVSECHWNTRDWNTRVGVFEVGRSRPEPLYEWEDCIRGLMAASPDGKWLVVGTNPRDAVGRFDYSLTELLVLDLTTGKEQGRVKVAGCGRAVAFSPDGKTLALSTEKDGKGGVQLLDPATRKPRGRYALNTPPDGLAFSPTGKLIACSFEELSGHALDSSTGRVIRDIRTLGADERAAVTPGNRWFWGWDAATGRNRDDRPADFAPSQESGRSISRLVAAPDGRSVGAVYSDNGVALWDTADGRFIRYPEDKARRDDTIAFSPDGRTRVAASDYQSRLYFFDARTDGERRMLQLASYDFTPDEVVQNASDLLKTVWVSPDLRWAVTAVCDRMKTTRLLIRDLSGAEPPRRVSFSGKVAAWAWPNVVVWVPGDEGTGLANVVVRLPGDEGTGLAVVSAVTGRTRVRIPGEFERSDPLAPSPDGRLVAVFSDEPARVEVYETATGRTVRTVRTGPVEGMAIAPDGRRLVTAGAGGFRVWDLATGEERTAHSSRWRAADQITLACKHVVVTADGQKAIADAADGTGFVWDLGAFPAERLRAATSGADWEGWWADLLRPDAGPAYAALWRFSDAPPDAVVRFLAARLKPFNPPDPAAVRRWVADLDDDDFRTREAAQGRLAACGRSVGADLLRAFNGHDSPEVRRRAGELLAPLSLAIPRGESLRSVRAIALLERIGTVEARAVLTALAAGPADADETDEAKAALERLAATKRIR